MFPVSSYDQWKTTDPASEAPECPECGGAVESDGKWEGRCVEGGYDADLDRYGCGWSWSNLP